MDYNYTDDQLSKYLHQLEASVRTSLEAQSLHDLTRFIESISNTL